MAFRSFKITNFINVSLKDEASRHALKGIWCHGFYLLHIQAEPASRGTSAGSCPTACEILEKLLTIAVYNDR